MQQKIEQYLTEQRVTILKCIQDLIRIPTQNPPGENYQQLVERIKQEFGNDDLELRVYTKNNKPSLVVTWNIGAAKTVHLNGHYDVVPVTSNWTYAPFEPVIEGNKLFGRGAADMKAGLGVMVYTMKTLHALHIKPACNFELSFTPDEESGGIDGLGYLVEERIVTHDFAITLDGQNNIVNNAHKGVLVQEITVCGKSAHAAFPHRGINAFLGACELALELNKLNTKLSRIHSQYDTQSEIEKSPTLVVGGLTQGGIKFNTIPDTFTFSIDRRIIPEESIHDAQAQIEEVVAEFQQHKPEFTVVLKTILEALPACVDKHCTIARVLAKSIKKIKGVEPQFALLPGFLDMRYFVNTAKIECVNFGLCGGNLHGDDEFVELSSIFETIKIMLEVVLSKELTK